MIPSTSNTDYINLFDFLNIPQPDNPITLLNRFYIYKDTILDYNTQQLINLTPITKNNTLLKQLNINPIEELKPTYIEIYRRPENNIQRLQQRTQLQKIPNRIFHPLYFNINDTNITYFETYDKDLFYIVHKDNNQKMIFLKTLLKNEHF